MLTESEVSGEATTISAVRQALLVMELRRTPSYVANPALYLGLVDLVAAASGTTAQILNAGLRKLEGLGSKTSRLHLRDLGLDTDKERDRNVMREFLLSSLYEAPIAQPLSAVGHIPSPCAPCGTCGGIGCGCTDGLSWQ